MEIEVFNQILKCIPNTDRFKKYKKSIALNIYLVWCGIRPGCIPFDEQATYLEHDTPETNKILENLNKISGLRAVSGPYYDVGTAVVIYNTDPVYKVDDILLHIATARGKISALETAIQLQVKQSGIKNAVQIQKLTRQKLFKEESYKKYIGQVHIGMGKLLGFLCHLNLSEQRFYKNSLYSITYKIDRLNWSYGFWCKMTPKPDMGSWLAKLAEIRAAFNKLGLPEVIFLEMSIGIVEP